MFVMTGVAAAEIAQIQDLTGLAITGLALLLHDALAGFARLRQQQAISAS